MIRLMNNGNRFTSHRFTGQKYLLNNSRELIIKNDHSYFFFFKKKSIFINFFFSLQYEKFFFFFLTSFFYKLNTNVNYFFLEKNYFKFDTRFLQINDNHSFYQNLRIASIFFFYYNNSNFIHLMFYLYALNVFNTKVFSLNYFKIKTKTFPSLFLNNFFRNKIIKLNTIFKKKNFKTFNNLFKFLKTNKNLLLFQKLLNFKILKLKLKKKIKNIFFINLFFHFFYKSKIYYKNIVQKNIKNFLNIFKVFQFDNLNNFIKLSKNSTNLNKSNFVLSNTLNFFIYKKNNFKILYFLNKFVLNKKSLFSNSSKNEKNISHYFLFLKKKITKSRKYVSDLEFILNNNKFFYKIINNSYNKKNFYNHFKFNFAKINNFYIFSKLEFLFFFFFKPLFFKSFSIFKASSNFLCNFLILNNFKNNFYYSNDASLPHINLISNKNFDYALRKKIVKIFDHDKISLNTASWYNETLIRFLENYSGKKVYLKIFSFLNDNLNFFEKAQCLLWSQKVKYFRKILGPRLFLNESLQIIYLSLKLKDPIILSNWMVATMGKISFWKYKTFLRYIKYVLRYFFWVIFKEIKIKGIKFQLKGKISVAGNSRTRTAFHYVGFTSHATFDNKILYTLNLVKTFTGVLGLKLWIVF